MKPEEVVSHRNNSGNYYIIDDTKLIEVGNINNSILADTDNSLLLFKTIGNSYITYSENEKPSLPNIKFTVKTPHGNTLNYLNDSLIVSSIVKPTSVTNKIRLEFTEYFSSEEYSLGDNIMIQGAEVSTSDVTDLDTYSFVSFLNREIGHTIIGHYGGSDNTPITGTKLFKGLYIALPFTYNNDSSTAHDSIFTINSFNILSNATYTITMTSNTTKVINLSKQCLITLKITCMEYQDDFGSEQ
jgi:hypothetical protein